MWFWKNRSTIDQLVRLETFIRDAFVNKEHAVSVFFDLEQDVFVKHNAPDNGQFQRRPRSQRQIF